MVKKRILIFSYAYAPLVGGAEIAVREITDRISPDWIEFEMVTVRSAGAKRQEKIGNVLVHRVGYHLEGKGLFVRLVDWGFKIVFVFLAALKGIRLQKERSFDMAWSIMAAHAGFAAYFFHRVCHVPYALTLQEGVPLERIRRFAFFIKPLFRRLFRDAVRVQTISRFLAQFAKEEGASVVPIVIGNGVDVKLFSEPLLPLDREKVRESWGVTKWDIALVTASRLVTKNAVDVVIRALAELPMNVRLVVAGDGPDREKLESLAKELSVHQRIFFAGTVPQRELPKWYHAADMFIRPSRSEGFGNVFAESMAAGLPVIATAAGGIPDIVKDGDTGLICKIDDPHDLALKVQTLLSDESIRNCLTKNGFSLVSEKFDWNTIAKRMREEVFS